MYKNSRNYTGNFLTTNSCNENYKFHYIYVHCTVGISVCCRIYSVVYAQIYNADMCNGINHDIVVLHDIVSMIDHDRSMMDHDRS